jgi:hypothetical protein
MSFSRVRVCAWLLPAVVALAGAAGAAAAAADASAKPNIVLILTDDEDVAIHEFMPKTRALLERRGVRFEIARRRRTRCLLPG